MLKIENLSVKVGGNVILNRINLEVRRAEISALLLPFLKGVKRKVVDFAQPRTDLKMLDNCAGDRSTCSRRKERNCWERDGINS